jgi:hypothetical protein
VAPSSASQLDFEPAGPVPDATTRLLVEGPQAASASTKGGDRRLASRFHHSHWNSTHGRPGDTKLKRPSQWRPNLRLERPSAMSRKLPVLAAATASGSRPTGTNKTAHANCPCAVGALGGQARSCDSRRTSVARSCERMRLRL